MVIRCLPEWCELARLGSPKARQAPIKWEFLKGLGEIFFQMACCLSSASLEIAGLKLAGRTFLGKKVLPAPLPKNSNILAAWLTFGHPAARLYKLSRPGSPKARQASDNQEFFAGGGGRFQTWEGEQPR